MQINKKVVAVTDSIPFVVDLEDFPHGDLVSMRKDDNYDIEFYSVPEGVQVASYNELTGLPEFHDVKYWSIHKGKPIEIVNLEDGRQIITDNDPRAVYGISSTGDSLTPERFTPSEAMDKKVLVPVIDETLADDVKGMFYCFGDGIIYDHKENHMCVPLDFSFGQFVGAMAGDGWVSNRSQMCFSDAEGFNIKFIVDYLKGSAFPDMTVARYEAHKKVGDGRYGDTVLYRLNIGSNWFCDCMKDLFDGHRDERTSGSANKRLPIWYQFAGKDFIKGLVNGLIATDGTACISRAKSKPQLQISFSSTSLRLVREFRRCCQLLGVKSSISFSKNTSGGNKSWICSVSTIDAKRIGLLDKCCNERKRHVFESTNVNMSSTFVKNDIVPFPNGVAERLVHLVPSAKTHGVNLDSLGKEEKYRRLNCQSASINIRSHAGRGFVTRDLVRKIAKIGDEVAASNIRRFSNGMKALSDIRGRFSDLLKNDSGGSRRSWKVPVSSVEMDAISDMIVPVKPSIHPEWREDTYEPTNAWGVARRNGFITWKQVCDILAFFEKYNKPNTELRDSKDLAALVRLVDSKVTWLRIKSVEKTGEVEVGYDLTVPGPDTFVSDDGVVLSNTVNIHVPASDKAAKQALEKMLPSKNLFSLTDMKSVRYKPEKEQISGLWALTRGRTRKPTRYFSSKAEAISAYRNGEIGPNDPVEIKGVST